MVGRMEEIPEDVSRAFQDQKISIGGSVPKRPVRPSFA